VGGVSGPGDTGGSDTDPDRPGDGERDGSRQCGGHDASGDRDLFHLHGFGGRGLLGVVGVAQHVSRECG
jgi:hypothetical protein